MIKHKALRPAALVGVGMGLVLGLSACGGSAPVSATSARPADTIVIKNFAFHPASLTVSVGATITVHNEDDSIHTVTADDGRFNTGNIKPGQTVTFQVHSAGTFPYHCAIHQFMHGSLTVRG